MAFPALDLSKSWQQVVDRFLLRPSNWKIIPFPANYGDDLIERMVSSTNTLRLAASASLFNAFLQSHRLLLTDGEGSHFIGNCCGVGLSKGIALETPVSLSATLNVRGTLYKGPNVGGPVRPQDLTGEYITVSMGGPGAVKQITGLTLIFLGVPSAVVRALTQSAQHVHSAMPHVITGVTSPASLPNPGTEVGNFLRDLSNAKLMGVLQGETLTSAVSLGSLSVARGFGRFRQVQVEIDWNTMFDPKRSVYM